MIVPAGLLAMSPAIISIFRPERVPERYASRIGAALAIRPKSFAHNGRDIIEFYRHVVRLSARYHRIRAPTEILTGDRDAVLAPTIHAYGLARDIPGARLTIIPGAGHMLHWAHAGEVAAAVERVSAASIRHAAA